MGKSHELVQIANLVADKASFSVKVGDVDIDMAARSWSFFSSCLASQSCVYARATIGQYLGI